MATMRSCSARPAAPVSANPAENTIAAFVPRRPSCSSVSGTRAAGTATMAVSGASGRAATVAKAGRPWISVRFGLTGMIWPVNPRASI